MIYECPEPITFKLDNDAQDRKIEAFLEWVYDFTKCAPLVDMLCVNKNGIMDNKVYKGVYVRETDEFVPEGMKLSKAIMKYYAGICGETKAEEVRCELSRIIQENSVTGKLCLSIHPLDFLSASENNNGWRSCHALDGEYRAGNLSYMMDTCTVMAYLKSDKEDVNLPRFGDTKWNNKKWRCWFFFDFNRNVVWAGRQYPFSSDFALKAVVEKLFRPLNFFLGEDDSPIYPWEMSWVNPVLKGEANINGQEISLYETYVASMGAIIPMHRYIRTHSECMGFNDLLDSSFYTPSMLHFASQFPYASTETDPMIVGGATPCVVCGHNHIAHSEMMVCDDCALDEGYENEDICECDVCGARVWSENTVETSDGMIVCADCQSEHVLECSCCGELFYVYDKDSLLLSDKPIECNVCRHVHQEEERTIKTHNAINSMFYAFPHFE